MFRWVCPNTAAVLGSLISRVVLRQVLVLSTLQEPSSAVLRDLQDSHAAFFLRCGELSQRVLRLMAHSLDLDPDIFLSAHQLVGSRSPLWFSLTRLSYTNSQRSCDLHGSSDPCRFFLTVPCLLQPVGMPARCGLSTTPQLMPECPKRTSCAAENTRTTAASHCCSRPLKGCRSGLVFDYRHI